jgi:hypothetical protein
MIVSPTAGGICCLLLSSQIQVQWGPAWLSVLLVYFLCAFFNLGAGTVPSVIYAEIFLPEVNFYIRTHTLYNVFGTYPIKPKPTHVKRCI